MDGWRETYWPQTGFPPALTPGAGEMAQDGCASLRMEFSTHVKIQVWQGKRVTPALEGRGRVLLCGGGS